jgi:hypothetical protein
MRKNNQRFSFIAMSLAIMFSSPAKSDTLEIMFLKLFEVNEFCAHVEHRCLEVINFRNVFTIYYQKITDPNSGPRRGRGGDDGP